MKRMNFALSILIYFFTGVILLLNFTFNSQKLLTKYSVLEGMDKKIEVGMEGIKPGIFTYGPYHNTVGNFYFIFTSYDTDNDLNTYDIAYNAGSEICVQRNFDRSNHFTFNFVKIPRSQVEVRTYYNSGNFWIKNITIIPASVLFSFIFTGILYLLALIKKADNSKRFQKYAYFLNLISLLFIVYNGMQANINYKNKLVIICLMSFILISVLIKYMEKIDLAEKALLLSVSVILINECMNMRNYDLNLCANYFSIVLYLGIVMLFYQFVKRQKVFSGVILSFTTVILLYNLVQYIYYQYFRNIFNLKIVRLLFTAAEASTSIKELITIKVIIMLCIILIYFVVMCYLIMKDKNKQEEFSLSNSKGEKESCFESKNRDYRIDNVKGLLTLLLLVSHLTEPMMNGGFKVLYIYVQLITMPLFCFISGYLGSFKQAKIIKGMIYPYMVFQTFYFMFEYYILGESPSFTYTTPYWFLWYLLSLAVWMIMLLFVDTENKHLQIKIIAGSFLLALLIGFDNNIGYYLTLSRTIGFFPFFIMGYYLRKRNFLELLEKLKLKTKVIVGIVVIGIAVGAIFYADIIDVRWFYLAASYEATEGNLIWRGLVYICSIIVGLAVFLIARNKNNYLAYIGRNSLYIYLLHGFVVKAFRKLSVYDLLQNDISRVLFLCFFVGVIAVILTSGVMREIVKPLIEYPFHKEKSNGK